MNTRIVHFDLTAFFVSVEQVLNPDLIGRPVIVAGSPEGRGVVTCASYEVRPYGVHAGMPTALALRKCPFAIRIGMHPEAYLDYSRKVQELLKAHSPVFEAAGLDEFYLDWTGCERLFGGNLARFARQLQEAIAMRFGLPCAVGIASNKITAKIACDQAKPVGMVEVSPGSERSFLELLPVKVLPGVGEVMLDKLRLRGIRTCGQLASLDSEYVGRTFGKWGLGIQESARGRGPQYLTPARDQKQISTEETFATDTRDRKFLRQELHGMALSVSEELRSMERRARCIHLKLRYSDWVDHTRQTTVHPTNDPAFIYSTALSLLDATDTRRVTIRLIGIGVSRLTEDNFTINLFRQDEERKEWLLKAVDRINHRYEDTLVRVGCGV